MNVLELDFIFTQIQNVGATTGYSLLVIMVLGTLIEVIGGGTALAPLVMGVSLWVASDGPRSY